MIQDDVTPVSKKSISQQEGASQLSDKLSEKSRDILEKDLKLPKHDRLSNLFSDTVLVIQEDKAHTQVSSLTFGSQFMNSHIHDN